MSVLDLDLLNEVLVILQHAKPGKGGLAKAMTAYQALEVHPRRDELIKKHGRPGRGSGSTFSAAQVVSRALMKLKSVGAVKFRYVHTGGMFFVVASEPVIPGYEVCAFYQLTTVGATASKVDLQNGKLVLLEPTQNAIVGFGGTLDLDEESDDDAA